jgi:pectinesterase
MIKHFKIVGFIAVLIFQSLFVYAGGMVWKVSQKGNGQFTSIQAAIDKIPANNNTFLTILIDAGVYKEKLLIKYKNNFQLVGAGMDKTIITQSIARDAWRCDHEDDWGVATVNVDSSYAINFSNLTIQNNYGFENTTPLTIACTFDSTNQKIVQPTGHQMAFRSFYATQLNFTNCHLKAFGGDTMSPWNTTNGMFYLKDCVLEGGVDFYCPRGWAYAENCRFISNTGPAAIWHDGSLHEDAKSVLVNCTFTGFDGFNLGRFHRDAQFYLIKCHFASNMSSEDIYQVKTTNTLRWPRRVFYFDCDGGNTKHPFYKNNVELAKGKPNAALINAAWVFGENWDPIKQLTANKL